MSHEHNEQRMKDVEIPLFELEQRVEKLENNLSAYQIDIVGKMTEAISAKFNTDMATYLPKVKMTVDGFKDFKEKVEARFNKLKAEGGIASSGGGGGG